MTPTTLLVIDDELVILELVREVMDEHVIVGALTVKEARKAVEGGLAFDVAIVDKNLPDGSGLDVLKWLRDTRPDCEALMMTGYPSMDSAVEAIAAGATDYLIKPMRDIAEMRLRVNNAVERVQRARAAKALTKRLEESERRYRDLFEASPDAVLVLDVETRAVLDANVAAERLYARTREQLIGITAGALTAAKPAPMIRDGVIARHERRPDGTTVSVEVTTTITQRAGQAILVEVVRDVSERERAATERQELEQRLVRAGRLEALGRLAAGIAHDFNNLLCVIGVGSELASDMVEDDPKAVQQELAQIQATVQSATALTKQLLAFSGRQLTRPQIVDVNARVEQVAKMLERTLGARVKLVLDLAQVPLTVQIDPSHLEQVVTNLAVNARDAMIDGGTLTIATKTQVNQQGVTGVGISVRDTGSGIPADILADIFEPFFTTKGPEKGTGLGLATVHEITKRAGGTISVTSKLREGTLFEIWFPAIEGVAYDTLRLASVVPAGRGERILVVEDDPCVRDVTRRVLAAGGYAVLEARDGEEALAYVTNGGRVDAVVADIELPGMSGVECTKKIAERDQSIRFMYTSGMTSDPRGNGAVAKSTFLPKPYTPDELMRSVRKTLDSKR